MFKPADRRGDVVPKRDESTTRQIPICTVGFMGVALPSSLSCSIVGLPSIKLTRSTRSCSAISWLVSREALLEFFLDLLSE